jgi:hypothetical protein
MIIEAINNVCAKAPTGVEKYADLLLGWVKWGVAAVIIGAGFVSVGALVVGKLGSMSRAAQLGASGLIYSILAAVGYVTIYGILNSIVGSC